MKVWVVVDIGCIECAEPSSVLGVYSSQAEAEEKHKLGGYFSGGQHEVLVFEAEVAA